MEAFKPFIAKVATGAALTRDEARAAFETMLSGEVTPAQAGAFLMGLRVRGEALDEIVGAVSAMRGRMVKVEAPKDAIDIVGTGGDNAGSWNVSTLSAVVVAGCGVPVAKHGNRAASSKSGSADVLMALGVNLDLGPADISRCIREAGVGFMFAPNHHPSMRHVAAVRSELGARTIFNILGPLSNPASVRRQLLGSFSASWLEPMVQVLQALGAERIWAVHGSDGLDEITTTGPTQVVELKDGRISSFTVSPEDVGLRRAAPEELKGGDPQHNASAAMRLLQGEPGAYRDIVALNAGASLVVAGKAADLAEGVRMAQKAIDDGSARRALEKLVTASHAGAMA
ncbi:anthranilate phosphoribosyltransferase [Camelimonas abortus]|uniref:Anthranilate phosphoribosyltransferase n=1 Tax=Camelimonas abortus TaxID=1017184 RepID=A0ABV7LGZ9_9HYPH